jgi:hypothetical protein
VGGLLLLPSVWILWPTHSQARFQHLSWVYIMSTCHPSSSAGILQGARCIMSVFTCSSRVVSGTHNTLSRPHAAPAQVV